jgi:hypothetical protein
MNITTSLLPPLLMVIAVAYAIHVISGYVERLGEGQSRAQALHWTLAEMLPSCFWTAATTAIGFASLLAVRIERARRRSRFSASCVVRAIVLPALSCAFRSRALRTRRVALRTWSRARGRPALASGALARWNLGRARVEVATTASFRPTTRSTRPTADRVAHRRRTPFEVEVQAYAGRVRTPRARALTLQRGHELPKPAGRRSSTCRASDPG